ncbi:MAG: hypothetical protein M3Y79_05775, partial [Pseudomonadota bacterium]|nr:hypothetical protein [Pseudomonadota bacterium]
MAITLFWSASGPSFEQERNTGVAMRSLALVCAGLALVGGVVSVHLWRELRAERELTAQLRSDVGALRAGAPAFTTAEGAPSQRQALAMAPAPETASRTAPAAPAGNTVPPALDVQRLILNRGELLKDPEYRKAALMQARLNLPQRYPGLTEELGLSTEEAERLFDLLAENQLDLTGVTASVSLSADGTANRAALEEANRNRQELIRQQEQKLQTELGGVRYAQWQEYQQTLGPRQQVAQLGRNLESAGVPITSDQSRPLIAAYAAEQKRQSDDLRRLLGTGPISPADQQRVQEERLRAQAESNRRLVEAARPHLNARQVEALQASLEQQLAMNRASNRMMEIQRQAQGAGAAPAAAIQGTVVF